MGRAVAGIGSAGIFSGAPVILAHSVALSRRPMYTGAIGAMYGIASVTGPLLGGAFADRVTLALVLPDQPSFGRCRSWSYRLLLSESTIASEDHVASRPRRFLDPLGTAIFMPAIICLLLALQWGGTTHPWNNWRIITPFLPLGVLLSSFSSYNTGKRRCDCSSSHSFFPTQCLGLLLPRLFFWAAPFMGRSTLSLSGFRLLKALRRLDRQVMNLPSTPQCCGVNRSWRWLVSAMGFYTPFMILGSILARSRLRIDHNLYPDTSQPIWIDTRFSLVPASEPVSSSWWWLAAGCAPDGRYPYWNGTCCLSPVARWHSFSYRSPRTSSPITSDNIAVSPPAWILSLSSPPVLRPFGLLCLGSFPGVVRAFNDALTAAFLFLSIASAVSLSRCSSC